MQRNIRHSVLKGASHRSDNTYEDDPLTPWDYQAGQCYGCVQ